MTSCGRSLLLFGVALSATRSGAFVVTTATTGRRCVQKLPTHSPTLLPNVKKREHTAPHVLHAQAAESSSSDKLSGILNSNQPRPLYQAARFLQSSNDYVVSRDDWDQLFDLMEQQTAADQISQDDDAQLPPISQVRTDLTQLYRTLQTRGDLKVFGSMQGQPYLYEDVKNSMTPQRLEETTNMKMEQLTPSQSNALLWAGVAAAIAEGCLSVATGINLNLIVLTTLLLVATDRILLNGGVTESLFKVLRPDAQQHIVVHEASHFLLAYILGCPVEGVVVSAWGANQDARFRSGVTAGTSFYDAELPIAMQQNSISRTLVDRYSVIVMAGIAGEALKLGKAEGGASDELALVRFLSNLRWDGNKIKTQARWSAVIAVDLLQKYQPCLDALIKTLESGTNQLGACVYAIEKAARDHNLDLPANTLSLDFKASNEEDTDFDRAPNGGASQPPSPIDVSERLRDAKSRVEQQLRDTEEQLKNLNR